MSKFIDADRLRAEIEKVYKSEIQPWLSGVSATSAIYDYVLPLIDSLQKEQPPAPADLEEAAREYAFNNAEDGGEVVPRHLGFIAGAKWQHERDWRLIEAAHKHGFDAGSNWQKEQMLREAVEGRVISNEGISFPVSNEIHRLKLMEGDKVRITIVKED